MLWALLALCFIPLLTAAMIWQRGARARRLTRDLPGWPQLPILGNAHYFFGGSEVIFKRFAQISEICDSTNKAFKFWFGPKLVIFSVDPEYTKIVTNTFIEKPYYYKFIRYWVGDGLITAPGAVWKHNIKNIGNTFNSNAVDGFQDIFNHQARRLVERLKSKVGKEPFDAMEDLASITLESICQTTIGCPDISTKLVTKEYYEAFNRCLDLLVNRSFNLFLHPDCIYRLTPSFFKIQRDLKVLRFSDTFIRDQRTISEANDENSQDKLKRGKFRPVLDILIDLSKSDSLMTDQQICDEINTMIVAGHETTATALFYTLLLIGSHENVQRKLYDEIKDIFGDSKRPVEKEDLAQMKYCEAVINESLRYYPPIMIVQREATFDLKLENYTIPAGTICVINAWGTGRSRRIWGADAAEFKPERWLDKSPPMPANFIPFSYGKRSCLGKKYTAALLKTLLAHCIRDLIFVADANNMVLKYDLTLRAAKGHLMQVQLRD